MVGLQHSEGRVTFNSLVAASAVLSHREVTQRVGRNTRLVIWPMNAVAQLGGIKVAELRGLDSAKRLDRLYRCTLSSSIWYASMPKTSRYTTMSYWVEASANS